MKPFFMEVLPWLITVLSLIAMVLAYVMFVTEQRYSQKLLHHWQDSVKLNQDIMFQIRQLENQLREARSEHENDREGWKML